MSTVSDDFNRANAGTLGANWTTSNGTMSIFSNRATGTGTNSLAIWTANSWDNDQSSEAKVYQTGADYPAVCVRVTDVNNLYYVYINAADHHGILAKIVSGTFSSLHDTATVFSDGDTLTLSVSGTTLTVKKNGSTVDTQTDASIGSGSAGILCGATNAQLDDWVGTGAISGTVPTLSSRTVPTGGTTLTATLNQSGCIPVSGTGGFTIGGSSAGVTVSSWAISGTTLTLTLAGGKIYNAETITLSYNRATTTDDISDSGGANFMANFTAAAVTDNSTQVPLTAGVASWASSTPSQIVCSATDATNGYSTITKQWQRSSDGGSSWGNLTNGGGVSGATTLNLTDGSAANNTEYSYRLRYTDSANTPGIVYSNELAVNFFYRMKCTDGVITSAASGIVASLQ